MSRDQSVTVEGPAGALEVAVQEGRDDGILSAAGYCAVVCHPHPQHGGTMDNKVVTTLVRAYAELGIPAARFNFRGVGASQGAYDEGKGEVDDLAAVADWFRRHTGARAILFAGFSFGSAVASNGCRRFDEAVHLTLVAPPVHSYNFSERSDYPCPVTVVIAGADELVEAGAIHQWRESVTPAPVVIEMEDASHFFHGKLVPLRRQLAATIESQLT